MGSTTPPKCLGAIAAVPSCNKEIYSGAMIVTYRGGDLWSSKYGGYHVGKLFTYPVIDRKGRTLTVPRTNVLQSSSSESNARSGGGVSGRSMSEFTGSVSSHFLTNLDPATRTDVSHGSSSLRKLGSIRGWARGSVELICC